MSDFQILDLGSIDTWRDFHGGFSPARSRDGRRVLERDLPMEFFGLTANSMVPGEEAGYWHAHAQMEELYLFLTGEGEMGLDDEVIPVRRRHRGACGPGRDAHVALRARIRGEPDVVLHPWRRRSPG